MQALLDIPFADLRPLLGVQVTGPDWRFAPSGPDRQFLRSMGMYRTSRDVGASAINRWPTETQYVEADGALRLAHHSEADFPRISQAVGTPVRPGRTFRRVWCDGRCVWHFQLGLELGVPAPASFAEVRALVADLQDLSVRLRLPGGGTSPARRWGDAHPLFDQVSKLGDLIQAATTVRTGAAPPDVRHLLAGTPLIYLETTQRRRLADPDPASYMPGSRLIDGSAVADGVPLQMHFYRPDEGDCAVVWVETGGAHRTRCIELRLNLQRLHAEREVLKRVLRSRSVMQQPGPALEKYLADADGLLALPKRFGYDQGVLAAFAAYDELTPGQRQSALDFLAGLPQTRARAARLMERLEVRPTLSPAGRKALSDFLNDAYDAGQLRALVRTLPEGNELAPDLLEGPISRRAFVDATIDLLVRHGALGVDFFTALRESRRAREGEIKVVEALFLATDAPGGEREG